MTWYRQRFLKLPKLISQKFRQIEEEGAPQRRWRDEGGVRADTVENHLFGLSQDRFICFDILRKKQNDHPVLCFFLQLAG